MCQEQPDSSIVDRALIDVVLMSMNFLSEMLLRIFSPRLEIMNALSQSRDSAPNEVCS